MRKLRFRNFLLVGLFTLVVPFNVLANEFDEDVEDVLVEEVDDVTIEPFAAGKWDPKGSQTLNLTLTTAKSTNTYIATDGGNFKIDITGNRLENYVEATIVVNGNIRETKGIAYGDRTGTIEFNNIPVGAKVWFIVVAGYSDILSLEFFD